MCVCPESAAIVTAAVAKAAADNEVVYTSPVDGHEYRKSDNAQLIALAKREAEAREAVEKVEVRALAKACIGALAGGDEVHDFIVRAIRKSGGTAEQKQSAYDALKSGNAAMLNAGKAIGADPATDGTVNDVKSTYAALEKGVTVFAATHKIAKVWTDGLAAFAMTPEGAQLKSAYDNARAKVA